jgi:hypothetical protein
MQDNVEVAPGETVDHYQPPSGAGSIYAVCHTDCRQVGILHYEDPDAYA